MDTTIKKSEFIWNTIGSIFASLLSVVLLFVITRVNGVDDAGMFSIAFSSATILYTIADSQVRVFQVTDTDRKYGFGVYLSVRNILSLLRLIAGVVFVFVSRYDWQKALVCMGLVVFRMIDALSETYQGEFQLDGRLDIGGKSVFYRMLISLAVFGVVDVISKNLLVSIFCMCLTNLIIWIAYDRRLVKQYNTERCSKNKQEIKEVIYACFPLFVSMFLNNYIINAPKYAIDKYMTYEMQTYFNIIYLPTFVINLMSIFVLKPMLKTMGIMWNTDQKKKFAGILGKMILAILVLTIIAEVVGYFIGIPILSWIYGVDLKPYKIELLILIVSGGLSAITVALLYALSTMRCQGKSSIAYIAAAVSGVILPYYMVSRWGILGASVSSVGIMAILSLGLLGIFLGELRTKKSGGTM